MTLRVKRFDNDRSDPRRSLPWSQNTERELYATARYGANSVYSRKVPKLAFSCLLVCLMRVLSTNGAKRCFR
jgi:hypothetical protein